MQGLTDNIKYHYHNLYNLGLQCLTHYEYCQRNLVLETYEWDNTLTFKQLSWYLNFSAQFKKNMSITWTEKDKVKKGMEFCGKWNTDYTDLKNAVNFLVT